MADNTSVHTANDDGWGSIGGATGALSTHNIIGATFAGIGITHGAAGNLLGVDPLLNPVLADNGGPTKTHALLAGGPAFDAGNNEAAYPLVFDQRRLSRFKDGNLDGLVSVDMGAYEADADEYFASLGV